MIWADRVGVAWGMFVIGIVLLAHNPEVPLMGPALGQVLLKLVFVPWAVLRLIDFCFGGPFNRRSKRAHNLRPIHDNWGKVIDHEPPPLPAFGVWAYPPDKKSIRQKDHEPQAQ